MAWYRRCIAAGAAFLLIFLSCFSYAENITRAADSSTLNDWIRYFGPGVYTTEHTGGVWTDKSVFLSGAELDRALGMNTALQTEKSDHFLAALSAIASSKSIDGHSVIPTDTVFVVDFSGSMREIADSATRKRRIDALIDALNDSITKLLELNVENRIGVVMYRGNTDLNFSGTDSSEVLIPLGRYTPTNGQYLSIRAHSDTDNYVGIVEVKAKELAKSEYTLSCYAGTYIQSGLLRAWEEVFSNADTVVSESGDPLQRGRERKPVLILMSDGAPTAVTSNYTSQETANGGNNRTKTSHDEMGFVTQLTASYVRSKINSHYNADNNGHNPLVYTLGLALGAVANDGSGTVGKSVMNPIASTEGIHALWRTYLSLSNGQSMNIKLQKSGENDYQYNENISVVKRADASNKNYVDRYFDTQNAAQLTDAFNMIVQEIILQSIYYPTNVESGDHLHDGYVEFEDRIGSFMEVKDIKGLILDGKMYTGASFSKYLSEDYLGTTQAPSALGDEFILSVMTRLNIDKATARKLVEYAWGKTMYYNSETDFGNSLIWYADENRQYIPSYLENWQMGSGAQAAVPSGAVYRMESFGFLDDVDLHGKNSNLMYVSVQVITHLSSGESTLILKIPSVLIPLYTTHINGVDVNREDQGDRITYSRNQAEPLRLIYEVGLINGLNPYTVESIAGDKNRNDDGSYTFYTNSFDVQELENLISTENCSHPLSFKNTVSYFVPSYENEYYFYIQDSPLYTKNPSGGYTPYITSIGSTKPSQDAELYVKHHTYTLSSTGTGADYIEEYVRVRALTLPHAEQYLTGANIGLWYIPRGAVKRYSNDNAMLKPEGSSVSPVETYVQPFIHHHATENHASAVLGNNGKITLVPTEAGITVQAKKWVENTGTLIKGREGFNFVLEDSAGNVVASAVSDENGEIRFDLVFDGTDAGRYTYLLKEEHGSDPNTVYSDKTFQLDVYVFYTQNASLSVLGRWRGLEEGEIPLFINFYEAYLPPTGDNTPLILYALIAGISLLSVILLFRRRTIRK